MCKLDALMERPDERVFERDLETWVPEHRVDLVMAALTIMRAHALAGYPGYEMLEAYSRFKAWDKMVRGALVWMGEPDPWASSVKLRASDPERDALAGLMRAWKACFGHEATTTKDALDYQYQDGRWADGQPDDLLYSEAQADELRRALTGVFPGRGGANTSNLARYLNKMEGRIIEGMRFKTIEGKGGKPREYALDTL